jgi:IS30 family transposase
MLPSLVTLIESKLKLEWSSEQIAGWLKLNRKRSICHESIYLHIWEDKRTGGDLYLDLPQQGKKYDKRSNGKSTRGQIINRVCIDDRPSVVDSKSRIGDWEIDTVIGKGHSGALGVFQDSCHRFLKF